jgi:hypothetical protein
VLEQLTLTAVPARCSYAVVHLGEALRDNAKRPLWSAGKFEPWFDGMFPIEWVQTLAKVLVFAIFGLLTGRSPPTL